MKDYDRSSWQIKGEDVLSELIDLMALTSEDCALLVELADVARSATPALADAFYTRLLAHSETAEYIESGRVAKMRTTLANWFVDLFSGHYDADYARRRLIIGEVHVRIGLPVRYPLAMLDTVMIAGEAVTQQSKQPLAASNAFHKVLALDAAIFNQAYEDAQLARLSDLVGGERLARRLLQGAVTA